MIVFFLRTLVLYLLLVGVIRLMGKRQVGQMEPAEFVVTMLSANLVTIPMQDFSVPVYTGVIPIVTVLATELILSAATVKSVGLRRIFCGKPVILIENGKVLQKNLQKTRISLDELTGQLRLKDILDITQVQYAILETNGNFSVFPYPQFRPASAKEAGIPVAPQGLPYTIVCDGHLLSENLAPAGKDAAWVQRELKNRGATLQTTWYLAVDNQNHVIFYKREA